MTDLTYEGATAVVTGGARGIGRSIATELSRKGANVVIADLSGEAAAEAAEGLTKLGGKTWSHAVDVSDPVQVARLAERVYADCGRVDILVNNAGVTMRPFRAIWEASLDDYRWMMDVNYFGIVHGILAFVPRMREQSGRRHIVNTSSTATISRNVGHTMYGASKSAVDALSDTLRDEFIDHGDDIGVTVLYPGYITTMIAQTSEQARSSGGRSGDRKVTAYPFLDKRPPETFHTPLAPDLVGPMVLKAIDADAPYCTTHQLTADHLNDRTRLILNGYFPASEEA